jgi:hypothetical protein
VSLPWKGRKIGNENSVARLDKRDGKFGKLSAAEMGRTNEEDVGDGLLRFESKFDADLLACEHGQACRLEATHLVFNLRLDIAY